MRVSVDVTPRPLTLVVRRDGRRLLGPLTVRAWTGGADDQPRGDWIDLSTHHELAGGGQVIAAAPLSRTPVWVRRGALIVTYPAAHVASGLGDTPERERPLEATLWGEPPSGRAVARLADGTVVRWTRGEWSVMPERPMTFARR